MSVYLSLAIIGFVCAAAAGAAGWFVSSAEKRAAGWLVTQGVVIASEARRTSAETFDHRRQLAWVPHVRYRYSVGGKMYVGDGISHREYLEFAGDVEAPVPEGIRTVVKRYREGMEVGVHYDPAAPDSAVLEIDGVGTRLFGLLTLGFGVGGFVFFAAWVIALRK
jgi:hypothetical protein